MSQDPKRHLIGIGWIYLHGQYDLHKILATPVVGHTGKILAQKYHIERVSLENRPAAFRWIRVSFWRDWGVWYAGHPGIVFTPDLIECIRAVHSLHRPAAGELLRYPNMIPAPVAFDWTEFTDGENKHGMVRYRYISPKRTKREIWRMRNRYPGAGDVAFLPEDIAAGKRDENGNPIGNAPVHDWTKGWAF